MAEPSDDASMVALAVHPREKRAAVYRGTNAIEFPVTFEGIRGDDLEVDSLLRQKWFGMFGWEWVVAEQGTPEGSAVEQTVDDLRDGAAFREAFADGLVDLGGAVCNHCDHAFTPEGSAGGKLGPTCPECGHPADDPKAA